MQERLPYHKKLFVLMIGSNFKFVYLQNYFIHHDNKNILP